MTVQNQASDVATTPEALLRSQPDSLVVFEAPPIKPLRKRLARIALLTLPLSLGLFFGVPVCPSAILLRQPCPGCGLTRATKALLLGDVHHAMHMNPVAPLVVPIYAGLATYALYNYLRHGDPRMGKKASYLVIGSFALLAVVWIARTFGAFGGPVPV